MTDENHDPLSSVRQRLLGDVRLALAQARTLVRELHDEGSADRPELDELAARTDRLLAELEALGAADISVSDLDEARPFQSSSSSSSSSGSSVA